MYKYKCMNPIAKIGLNNFSDEYQTVDNVDDAEGILVRSANMLEMEFSDNLLAIARAGAGVNNIPLDRCAEKGIVVFNTPGANANGVKEMVLAAMLIASRDIIGGMRSSERSLVSSDLALSVSELRMPQDSLVWMFTDTILIFQSMLHGDFHLMLSTLQT